MVSGSTRYSEYLQLDGLLNLQKPLSAQAGQAAHEEMLFIVVHQTHELWFKQVHHELDSVLSIFSKKGKVDERDMGSALMRMNRMVEIFRLLIGHLRVLQTMAPLDFLEFRDFLVPASGFQSVQFRLLELKLGVLTKEKMCPMSTYMSVLNSPESAQVNAQADNPSLHHWVCKWLERAPFLDSKGFDFWTEYRKAVRGRLEDDRVALEESLSFSEEVKKRQLLEWTKNEEHFEALFDEGKHEKLRREGDRSLSLRATQAALFIHLYRDQPLLQLPYQFLNQLVELDEAIQNWRSEHANMVHRMIGVKVGTGGSMGYPYLKSTLSRTRVFGDLCNLSTFLIPRTHLPKLPSDFARNLSFFVDALGH
jgi:tryptophan 2,3-dioxygenase